MCVYVIIYIYIYIYTHTHTYSIYWGEGAARDSATHQGLTGVALVQERA